MTPFPPCFRTRNTKIEARRLVALLLAPASLERIQPVRGGLRRRKLGRLVRAPRNGTEGFADRNKGAIVPPPASARPASRQANPGPVPPQGRSWTSLRVSRLRLRVSSFLSPQVYNGDGFAAVLFAFKRRALDQGMGLQKRAQAFAQRPGSVAVNDAHLSAMSECGFVEELVDTLAGLFDGHADNIDFALCRAQSGSGGHGDLGAPSCCASRPLGGLSLDADDFIDRDLHAQRAGLDFGGWSFEAAQNHRLAESADAHPGAGLQLFRADLIERLRFYAEILLRFGNRLHDGSVQFFSGFAANVEHFPAGRLFELRAQFTLLDGLHDARDIFLEALLHFREFLFQFRDALLLAVHPIGAQLG